MRKRLLFATALAVIVGGAMTAATPPAVKQGRAVMATKAVPPVYDIYEIPVALPTDVYTEGVGVSKGGITVGRLRGIEKYHAFTWTLAGGLVVVPNHPLRPDYGAGFGVNDFGAVVGVGAANYEEENRLPLIWQNGSPSILPFDVTYTNVGRAHDINSSGVAVGSIGGSGDEVATIFTGPKAGVIQTFTPGGAWFVTAYRLNDKGVVVGQGRDPNNAARYVPFVYDIATDTAYELQPLPGHNGGIAFAVSNRGHVAGISQLGQSSGLPVVWDPDGHITAIPLPPDTFTGSARGVKSNGWVVGYAGGVYSVAFLSDGTTTYRLQDLIPKDSGWDLSQNTASTAEGISENGVIVGTGVYNGEYRAYAMIPRTEVSLSATSLTFPAKNVGTTIARVVLLTNHGSTPVTLTSITATGDFRPTKPCAAVQPGGSCAIFVLFTPTQTGPRTGLLTITDSDPASPQIVALTGTGTSP